MKRVLLFALFFVLMLTTILLLSLSQAEDSLAAGEIWLAVNYDHDWAYTETDPHTEVTFTVTGDSGVKATLTATTDGEGSLWTGLMTWDPEDPDIEPGDGVKVASNGSVAQVDPVGTIESSKDAEKDTISGVINAPGQTKVTVHCVLLQGDDRPQRTVENVSGNKGTFSCDFSKSL